MENIKFKNPVIELCPYCGTEVERTHLISKCPQCSKELTSCNECVQPLYAHDGCLGCIHGSNFKRANNYLFSK